MKLIPRVLALPLLMAAFGLGQSVSKSNEATSPSKSVAAVSRLSPAALTAQSAAATPADELKAVLAKMNIAAANFKSLQADFDWETFDKLIKETEVQNGQAYFRRQGRDLETLYNFNAASSNGSETLAKQALYKGGRFSLYDVKINQITEREVGKYKSDVDAFMSLGLGGRGDELATSFTVNWQGWETIDGVKTAKLEVTGKSPSIQKVFSRAVLWIDPERDIVVRQQFFQTSGDYRLIRYHNIKFNEKMSDGTFRLKTTGKPEIVHMNAD
jgi:outer membrane lipoprotein-sorting protein